MSSKLIEDKDYPGMYRIHWPDGKVSDMVNKTRAKDAIRRFEEADARRKREGAAEPLGSPLVSLMGVGAGMVALDDKTHQ